MSRTEQVHPVAKLIIIFEYGAIDVKKFLTPSTHTAYDLSRFQHFVDLHYAAVGETAVVFIFFGPPRKWAVAASASARLGKLGCTIEVAEER